MSLMGRERMLEGLREFIARYRNGPDYPLLQDLSNTLRELAPDTIGFDDFVDQWYYDVVIPEYRVEAAETHPLSVAEGSPGSWETTFTVRNIGTGRIPVDVAVTVGRALRRGGGSAWRLPGGADHPDPGGG